MTDQVNAALLSTVEVKQLFTFRPVDKKKLDKLCAEVDGTVNVESDFEVVEKGADDTPIKWKRKPVEATIKLPAFVNDLPDSLSKQLVQDCVASYVKNQYVDMFLPIGNHEWTAIADAISGRGTASINISDSVLALTAQSFGEFLATATGNSEAGERITNMVNGKVTQNAIAKYMGVCNPTMIEKLKARLESWGNYIADSGDENADELADGFNFVMAKLTKLEEKFNSNVTKMMADIL